MVAQWSNYAAFTAVHTAWPDERALVQAEEDAYPIYSPYVETEAVPVEVPPTEEETEGPSWFFVVRHNKSSQNSRDLTFLSAPRGRSSMENTS